MLFKRLYLLPFLWTQTQALFDLEQFNISDEHLSSLFIGLPECLSIENLTTTSNEIYPNITANLSAIRETFQQFNIDGGDSRLPSIDITPLELEFMEMFGTENILLDDDTVFTYDEVIISKQDPIPHEMPSLIDQMKHRAEHMWDRTKLFYGRRYGLEKYWQKLISKFYPKHDHSVKFCGNQVKLIKAETNPNEVARNSDSHEEFDFLVDVSAWTVNDNCDKTVSKEFGLGLEIAQAMINKWDDGSVAWCSRFYDDNNHWRHNVKIIKYDELEKFDRDTLWDVVCPGHWKADNQIFQ